MKYFWSLHDFIEGLRDAIKGMCRSLMLSFGFLIQRYKRTRISHEHRDPASGCRREQHCSWGLSLGRERIFDRLRHGHTTGRGGANTNFVDSIRQPTSSPHWGELYQDAARRPDEAHQRAKNSGYIPIPRIRTLANITGRVPSHTFRSPCSWVIDDTLILTMWNRSFMCSYCSFSPMPARFPRGCFRMHTKRDLFYPLDLEPFLI